ncbi:tetratricopeptide repeat protein [Pseudoalteromonas tunicata]|uniref:TPR repeats containing protein n=1 Tax=Pseudoalteromonas tunicata D2 TaxID=87626 RepID=A4C4K8_9GAMM|nr:hypothetical protein [Pseudoalteromonas tunicata]ATC97029.1 hypothetical protein PTUN_b0682 [Pseudoalteromonas tunicata]AXT33148.1 hypothetical protein D1819_20235 [Pseudoalteromonas tunicata]EAR30490.1 TPR repeats containing protein [Pseudoalteromonas tunicata D2]
MKFYKKLTLAGCLLVLFASNSHAAMEDELLALQHQWAKVNYQLADKAQEQAFEGLISDIEQYQKTYADKAEGYIWLGIIKSSFAGAKGGISALGLAKEAKSALETALSINPNALDGSAYTSLGTLYSKVPGWPLGFGDDKKAEDLLKKALTINPKGIDPNYFYGQYLYDDKQYSDAKKYLEIAHNAAPRVDRPLADQYRQHEIAQLLDKVEKKLKKKK